MEVLKPINEITQSDERNRYRSLTLEDLHSIASHIALLPSVPEPVHNQFQIARNAFTYSYFFYPFQSVALMYSILAIELALSVRLKQKHPKMFTRKRPPMLTEMLRAAICDRLLLDSGFDVQYPEDHTVLVDPHNPDARNAPHDQRYCYTMLHSLRDLRNKLAHGEYTLAPGMSHLLLRGAELINQLFPSDAVLNRLPGSDIT